MYTGILPYECQSVLTDNRFSYNHIATSLPFKAVKSCSELRGEVPSFCRRDHVGYHTCTVRREIFLFDHMHIYPGTVTDHYRCGSVFNTRGEIPYTDPWKTKYALQSWNAVEVANYFKVFRNRSNGDFETKSHSRGIKRTTSIDITRRSSNTNNPSSNNNSNTSNTSITKDKNEFYGTNSSGESRYVVIATAVYAVNYYSGVFYHMWAEVLPRLIFILRNLPGHLRLNVPILIGCSEGFFNFSLLVSHSTFSRRSLSIVIS